MEKTTEQVADIIQTALLDTRIDFSKVRASGNAASFDIRLPNGQEFRVQLAEILD